MTLDWLKEPWATDLMRDIVVGVIRPTTKEAPPSSPLGAKITFSEWIIPVGLVGCVLAAGVVLWLFLKGH